MLEAMWSVEFISNLNDSGYGVAIFETGRILGGDSSFTFIGSYEVVNGNVQAKVKCSNYREALPSIFGDMKEFNLVFEGVPAQNEFEVCGYIPENTQMRIKAKLTRIAELP